MYFMLINSGEKRENKFENSSKNLKSNSAD